MFVKIIIDSYEKSNKIVFQKFLCHFVNISGQTNSSINLENFYIHFKTFSKNAF